MRDEDEEREWFYKGYVRDLREQLVRDEDWIEHMFVRIIRWQRWVTALLVALVVAVGWLLIRI